jgi:maltose-binding protein MalE
MVLMVKLDRQDHKGPQVQMELTVNRDQKENKEYGVTQAHREYKAKKEIRVTQAHRDHKGTKAKLVKKANKGYRVRSALRV